MASDGPSPHHPSLCRGFVAYQPSRRINAQSLLPPSFHDLRTPYVLRSHPERDAPLAKIEKYTKQHPYLCPYHNIALHTSNKR